MSHEMDADRTSPPANPFPALNMALFAFRFLPALVVSYAMRRVYRMPVADTLWINYALGSILYIVGWPVFVALGRKLPSMPHTRSRRPFPPGDIAMACLAGFGSMFAISSFFFGFSLTFSDNPAAFRANTGPVDFVAMIALQVIGAPLVEEIIFRKSLFEKTAPYPTAAYVLYSSLAFSLIHMNIAQFAYTLPMGMLLAATYALGGRLRDVFTIHAVSNFLGVANYTLMFAHLDTLARLLPYANVAMGIAGIACYVVLARKYLPELRAMSPMLSVRVAGILANPGAFLLIAYFIGALAAPNVFR